jgi:hypothetical protein
VIVAPFGTASMNACRSAVTSVAPVTSTFGVCCPRWVVLVVDGRRVVAGACVGAVDAADFPPPPLQASSNGAAALAARTRPTRVRKSRRSTHALSRARLAPRARHRPATTFAQVPRVM